MKAAELRSKSLEQLQEELHALLREQFNLRMQRATGQLKRNHQMGVVRLNIARVKTVITELSRQN